MYWLLIIAFVLITPVFATYRYSIPYFLRLLVLTLFSAAFAIYIHAEEERKYQVRAAWIMSTVLFFLFGFFALLDTVAGYQEVQKKWYVDDYKIEYIKDQGFAGGPLMKYQLNRYGIIPLFIKKVDVVIDRDSMNGCLVTFVESRVVFKKCNSTLTKNAP
jgi:hypothetical protein